MNPNVVNFFKRNPEAKYCHLVLQSCFKTAHAASSYQKNMGAKKVSVVSREDYETWAASNSTVAGEVKESNNDQEDQ